MPVTNNDLKKKLAEVTQQSRYFKNSTTARGAALEEPGTVFLSVEKIIKINNNYVITEKGTKARLFNPSPCFYWKCIGTVNNRGEIELKNKLEGLFITDGANSYCLGVDGASSEFESRMQVGNNEIRLNNSFLNLKAPHIVINGVEKE